VAPIFSIEWRFRTSGLAKLCVSLRGSWPRNRGCSPCCESWTPELPGTFLSVRMIARGPGTGTGRVSPLRGRPSRCSTTQYMRERFARLDVAAPPLSAWRAFMSSWRPVHSPTGQLGSVDRIRNESALMLIAACASGVSSEAAQIKRPARLRSLGSPVQSQTAFGFSSQLFALALPLRG